MNHTPEPWNVWSLSPDSDPEERQIITANDDQDEVTGIIYNIYDAERIVACVNFCIGLTNKELANMESLQALVDYTNGLLNRVRIANAVITNLDEGDDEDA